MIIEKISMESDITYMALVQDEEKVAVELHCVFTKPARYTVHDTVDEARLAAYALVEEKLAFYKKMEPAFALIRPKFQAMGVEGALEYWENARRKMGLPVK